MPEALQKQILRFRLWSYCIEEKYEFVSRKCRYNLCVEIGIGVVVWCGGKLTSSENGIIEILLFLSPICIDKLLCISLCLLHTVATAYR